MTTQEFFVYILRCKDNSYYVGFTTDLNRRTKEHLGGYGSGYTSFYQGGELLYFESHCSKQEALKREAQIKKWTRAKKEALITGNKNALKKLSISKQSPRFHSGIV